MARKVKNTINNIVSDLSIGNSKYCKDCPIRLYEDESNKVILGIGNIFADTIIILPKYDVNTTYQNTIFHIIKRHYRIITGKDILEDCYITRSIKCFINNDFNFDKYAINKCINYIIYEINRIRPKKIIAFNDAIIKFLLVKYNYITFYKVTHPGVMYYDNDKLKSKFINEFTNAINN